VLHPLLPLRSLPSPPFLSFPSLPPLLTHSLTLPSLWSAVNNFYVYKQLIPPSTSLHELLLCSIPSFLSALSDLEYALVVVNFLATLNDAHSYVNCESLINFVGTHVPPVKVRTVEGEFVVTHVFQHGSGSASEGGNGAEEVCIFFLVGTGGEEKTPGFFFWLVKKKLRFSFFVPLASLPSSIFLASFSSFPSHPQLQVGDIILSVDDTPASELRKKLQKVCFASTAHGQNVRVDTLLLAGKQDSSTSLLVRRRKSAFEGKREGGGGRERGGREEGGRERERREGGRREGRELCKSLFWRAYW
jgi:hypothetical protein